MATDADKTPNEMLGPMDRLLLDMNVLKSRQEHIAKGVDNFDHIRAAVDRMGTQMMKVVSHQEREGSRLRLAIGACVACAMICLACAFLTYSTAAAAALRLERLEELRELKERELPARVKP